MGLAVHLHHGQHKELPPSRVSSREGPSWAWLLLPNLEQQNLYNKWSPDSPFPGIARGIDVSRLTEAQKAQLIATLTTPVALYFCPSRRDPGGVTAAFPQDIA
jgi:hypothetical protein